MDFKSMSNELLLRLHEAVRSALNEDDRLSVGQKKYFVREYPDWKLCANEIEDVLKNKNVSFTPIQWQLRKNE